MTGIVVPVIEAPGAYDEAVKGMDGIIHAASPVRRIFDDPSEMIDPAVKGAIGILTSAAQFGKSVKRVVLTSSIVAVVSGSDRKDEIVYDEVRVLSSGILSLLINCTFLSLAGIARQFKRLNATERLQIRALCMLHRRLLQSALRGISSRKRSHLSTFLLFFPYTILAPLYMRWV